MCNSNVLNAAALFVVTVLVMFGTICGRLAIHIDSTNIIFRLQDFVMAPTFTNVFIYLAIFHIRFL